MPTDTQLLEASEKHLPSQKTRIHKALHCPDECGRTRLLYKNTVFIEENVLSLMSKALSLSPCCMPDCGSLVVINLEDPQLSHV